MARISVAAALVSAKRRWLSAALAAALALPALWHVGHLTRIVTSRITYPMDLEWMEGGLLYEATRIQQGLPIYPPPDQGYVPFPYPIGYPLVLALLTWVGEVDYALARAVSMAASCGAACLLARQVQLQFGTHRLRWLMVVLGVGAVAAGYPVVDGWYDLARVDSLAAFLVIGAAAAVSADHLSRERAIAGGTLVASGVLTKQSAAPLVAWICVFVLVRHRKQGALLVGVAAGLFALILGVLQMLTDGQYWFYTVTLLKEHRLHPERIREAQEVLLSFAPYAPALPVAAILLALRRRLSARSLLWLGLAVASWSFGIVSFGKDGGYFNNLMPAVWLVGPTALLLLGDALRAGERTDLSWMLGWLTAAAMSWLLLDQRYPAQKYLVPPANHVRAEALHQRVAALDGTLFAPLFPQLAVRQNKGYHQIHIEAHNDFIWAGRPFRNAYEAYLTRLSPDYVLLDGTEATADIVRRDYVVFEHLDLRRFGTRPKSGWSVSPRLLLKKRSPRDDVRIVFDFEKAGLRGWSVRGTALRNLRRVRNQSRVHGIVGKRFLNSFHSRRGDRATGSALSPRFRLDRPVLGFRVGGGFSPETRVELLVAGTVVRVAFGNDSEMLEDVAWDVAAFQGQDAQLQVVDSARGGFGHIMLDQVALYRRAQAAERGKR